MNVVSSLFDIEEKCSTGQRFIYTEVSSYKNHILEDVFLTFLNLNLLNSRYFAFLLLLIDFPTVPICKSNHLVKGRFCLTSVSHHTHCSKLNRCSGWPCTPLLAFWEFFSFLRKNKRKCWYLKVIGAYFTWYVPKGHTCGPIPHLLLCLKNLSRFCLRMEDRPQRTAKVICISSSNVDKVNVTLLRRFRF